MTESMIKAHAVFYLFICFLVTDIADDNNTLQKVLIKT